MEQLLKILENNARLPVEDIATMLNKSPAEVAAMMDLARAQGIIKGYKTLVDWEKAKVNRVEAVIELNVSPKKSRGFDEIAATIAAFDEVESVLLMSGGYDLQLVKAPFPRLCTDTRCERSVVNPVYSELSEHLTI